MISNSDLFDQQNNSSPADFSFTQLKWQKKISQINQSPAQIGSDSSVATLPFSASAPEHNPLTALNNSPPQHGSAAQSNIFYFSWGLGLLVLIGLLTATYQYLQLKNFPLASSYATSEQLESLPPVLTPQLLSQTK